MVSKEQQQRLELCNWFLTSGNYELTVVRAYPNQFTFISRSFEIHFNQEQYVYKRTLSGTSVNFTDNSQGQSQSFLEIASSGYVIIAKLLAIVEDENPLFDPEDGFCYAKKEKCPVHYEPNVHVNTSPFYFVMNIPAADGSIDYHLPAFKTYILEKVRAQKQSLEEILKREAQEPQRRIIEAEKKTAAIKKEQSYLTSLTGRKF